jgi:hypothetical protein
MIRRINSLHASLEALRSNGIQKGDRTGFESLDSIYSLKQGSYTIVLGEPGHGKSEFIFEILLNQSEKYGKIWLIYSPETGSIEEITAELVHKVTGKSFYKTNNFACSDKEYYDALAWIDGHFLIVDSDENAYSLSELYEMSDKFEKENESYKIAGIMADPYNELKHEMDSDGRQDLYIERIMGEMRRFCKKKNKHVILSVHPQAQSGQLIQKDGISFYPKPLPRQAAGGQALFRKAMSWITLWRPPVGVNMDGVVYEDNTVLVSVDKAKPKGVSFKGTIQMGFDWKLNRYYEISDGTKFYAFEREKYINQYEVPKHLTFDL